MTVREYARMMGGFHNPPKHIGIAGLLNLPLDTACGQDCAAAIKAAAELAVPVRQASGPEGDVEALEGILWKTMMVLYYG